MGDSNESGRVIPTLGLGSLGGSFLGWVLSWISQRTTSGVVCTVKHIRTIHSVLF